MVKVVVTWRLPQIDYTTFFNQVGFFIIVFLFLITYLMNYEIIFVRNKYRGKEHYFYIFLHNISQCLSFAKFRNVVYTNYKFWISVEKKPVFAKFFYPLV